MTILVISVGVSREIAIIWKGYAPATVMAETGGLICSWTFVWARGNSDTCSGVNVYQEGSRLLTVRSKASTTLLLLVTVNCSVVFSPADRRTSFASGSR